jgi:hypothetical protein
MHDASAVADREDDNTTSASLESIEPPTLVANAASPPNSPEPEPDADVDPDADVGADVDADADADASATTRGTASTTR